jgi:hypothetical protein
VLQPLRWFAAVAVVIGFAFAVGISNGSASVGAVVVISNTAWLLLFVGLALLLSWLLVGSQRQLWWRRSSVAAASSAPGWARPRISEKRNPFVLRAVAAVKAGGPATSAAVSSVKLPHLGRRGRY